jgi:hypothetical protein
VRLGVEQQVTDAQLADRLGLAGGGTAPPDGADAHRQLARAEGFCHVIVRPGAEALDDLLLLVESSQQDDRRGRILPDLLTDFQPREPRHLYVEDDEIGGILLPTAHGLQPVGRDDDIKPLAPHRVGRHVEQIGVVVNE